MGIVVRQSPEGRMEKTSGSNDGPNSFHQHGAPTRTARAGSRCAHQSAGTFDDTAAETRVPPSLDVRVLHVRRRGLAADWHVAVRCLMASIGMDSFTSLTSRTYSHSDRSILVADLRQISDLALISRRARMSGMSTAFKCRLKCTRRGWRSRPGVRPTGTGTRDPRVSVWISSRFARAESLLKCGPK
jgi:hypothetical protein